MDLHFIQSDGFRDWLDRQEGETLAWLSERIALREAPHLLFAVLNGSGHPKNPRYTPYLRCLITICALRAFPSDQKLQELSFRTSGVANEYLDNPYSFVGAANVLNYSGEGGFNDGKAAYAAYSGGPLGGRWCMGEVLEDSLTVARPQPITELPLWRAGPNLAEEQWAKVAQEWRSPNSPFAFWLRWYQAALDGKPLPWDLQRDIALIDEADWQAGPAGVAERIAEIEGRHQSLRARAQAEGLLHSALADYSFDALDRVMRMVPFEDDVRHLRDPIRLAAFLDDADAVRDDLELFSRGLAAEGNMQGAGFLRQYLEGVLDEFSRARQMSHLRVGRVVELGKIIEGYASSDQIAEEFGPAVHALRSHVRTLLDLTRRHFAATLTRMAPLRDITSSPDDNQWDLLQDIQRGIKSMSHGGGAHLPPLAKEDQAVLLSLAESIERLLRQHDVVSSPQTKSSLRREVDYRLALLAVSFGLYVERAQAVGDRGGKLLDWIGAQNKRVVTGLVLWELIKTGLAKLSG